MISYRTNAHRPVIAKVAIDPHSPKVATDPHRSLTAELAELSLLRENIRWAEARIQQRKFSTLFPPPKRFPLS